MNTSTYYKQNPAARKAVKQQGDYNKTKKGCMIRTALTSLTANLAHTVKETVKIDNTGITKVRQRQHLPTAVVHE